MDNNNFNTLHAEQVMDRELGLLLQQLRQRLGLTLADVKAICGFDLAELEDHEAGLLPIPASRLAILVTLLLRHSLAAGSAADKNQ